MKIKFIESMNDFIVDAYLEMEDKDANVLLKTEDKHLNGKISDIKSMLNQKVFESRAQRLNLAKERFIAHSNKAQRSSKASSLLNVDSMLKDIVDAIQNKSESVPHGILLAFRNQSKENDDQSIQEIWNDLVALGLIKPDESDD